MHKHHILIAFDLTCVLDNKVESFCLTIIDGPDYVRAKFEGQLQQHFNNHFMNIKMRELLFQKMYEGKIIFCDKRLSCAILVYFLVKSFFVIF